MSIQIIHLYRTYLDVLFNISLLFKSLYFIFSIYPFIYLCHQLKFSKIFWILFYGSLMLCRAWP